jgi:hypothetical protein
MAIASNSDSQRSTPTPENKFVSPSHRQSVHLEREANTERSLGNGDRAAELATLAAALAQSMGNSGRYAANPFSEKEQPDLHQQFSKANNLRMQREMDIVGKEADVGHGM